MNLSEKNDSNKKPIYLKFTAIIIVAILVTVFGIFSGLNSNVSLYPDAKRITFNTGIAHPGMSSDQFYQRYGSKVENSLMRHKDVQKVEAAYNKSGVQYSIRFNWNISSEEAMSELRKMVAPFEGQMPRRWGNFWMWSPSLQNRRVLFVLGHDTIPYMEWAPLFAKKYQPRFDSIAGVESTYLSRFDKKEVMIKFDPFKLAGYGLTSHHIMAKVQEAEYDVSFGDWSPEGSRPMHLYLNNSADLIEDIAELPIIANAEGAVVRLADVATVQLQPDIFGEIVKRNGDYSSFFVAKIDGTANLAKVGADVKALMEQITSKDLKGLKAIAINDPANLVKNAVGDVLLAVLIGIIAASFMILLFLRQFALTLITFTSIPLSLAGGLLLMSLFNIDVNLISIGAMAIASGMVVDGAIVVLENMVRRLENNQGQNQGRALKFNEVVDLVISSVHEIRGSLIASLATTIIVFLPLPFTSEIASAILGDLAVVMVCVLSVSLVVSLVVIPSIFLLCLKTGLLKIENLSQKKEPFIRRLYGKYLSLALGRKWISLPVLATAAGLLAYALAGFPELDRKIISQPKAANAWINFTFKDQSLTEEQITERMEEIEKEMIPYFDDTVQYWQFQVYSWEHLNPKFSIYLDSPKSFEKIKKTITDNFPSNEEYNLFVGSWNPASLTIEDAPDARLSVSGKDFDERMKKLGSMQSILSRTKEFARINTRPSSMPLKYVEFNIPPHIESWLEKESYAGNVNLSKDDIKGFYTHAFEKTLVRELEYDDEIINVKMQVDQSLYQSPRDLQYLPVLVGDSPVPMGNFVEIKEIEKAESKYYLDANEYMIVDIWKKDGDKRDIHGLINELLSGNRQEKAAASYAEVEDYSFISTGEEITKNIQSLLIALAFSVGLIFVVLIFQFDRIKNVLLIMLAIPLGVIGVYFSLSLFESYVSVNSLLGLILLAGTAVNNSILMLDFFINYQSQGKYENAEIPIRLAALDRVRPIMITTITTIIGMLPIAMAFGAGGEVLQPLGLAICGGLGVSTLLVLAVLPIMLNLFSIKLSPVQTS